VPTARSAPRLYSACSVAMMQSGARKSMTLMARYRLNQRPPGWVPAEAPAVSMSP
jgi:hypothetical protein